MVQFVKATLFVTLNSSQFFKRSRRKTKEKFTLGLGEGENGESSAESVVYAAVVVTQLRPLHLIHRQHAQQATATATTTTTSPNQRRLCKRATWPQRRPVHLLHCQHAQQATATATTTKLTNQRRLCIHEAWPQCRLCKFEKDFAVLEFLNNLWRLGTE
jgi:hypothetical protein